MPTDEISAQGHFEQGNTLASQGDYQGALEEYNQALQLDPNFAFAYRTRSFIRHALGDYQRALEDCNMQLQLNLYEADAYYNRSLIRHALGDPQGALEDCNMALQFLCKWPDTLIENIIQPVADFIAGTLIRGLIALGETQEVVDDLNPRWHRPCDKPNAYFRRGAIRSCVGDYQGALEDLNKAATLCSEHRNTALHQRVQETIATL